MFIINKYEALSYNQKPTKDTSELTNERVRFPLVLVIDETGKNLGTMSSKEAYFLAVDKELDLVCIAPNGKPPVCKILNYSKYKYEQTKKAKEAKKNQKVVELKEVRFTPLTDTHDLETKAKACKEWLKAGDKVKVTVKFKGRQMAHIEVGENTLKDFLGLVEEFATVEKEPTMEGTRLSCFIVPKKNK